MLGIEFLPLTLDAFSAAAFIFILRVCDVSIGTVRLIMIGKGQRRRAVIAGFFEVFIWVVAISQVISDLGSIWNILGYSGGYAMGTLAGMLIEEKMALGDVLVTIASRDSRAKIQDAMEKSNFNNMEVPSKTTIDGDVGLIFVLVSRKRLSGLLRIVEKIDEEAVVVVEDLRLAKTPASMGK